MPKKIILVLVTVFLSMLAAFGQQPPIEEVIAHFGSDIRINQDSSLIVTESITVLSKGIQIRHGIYRDFPTQYRDALGNAYRVDMQVLGAERDGKQEPWHVESRDNGVRIYIGSKDVLLPSGVYEYTLKYRTTRQLGYFGDHDELYWNVTGNGWVFPILHVTAEVHLPGGVRMDQVKVDAYTGPMGAQGKDYFYSIGDGTITFGIEKPLMSHEGLTISVGFPKGVVAEPTRQQQVEYFLQDNRTVLISLMGLTLALLYYLLVWFWVGRDPAPGDVTLRLIPPAGLSPAAARNLVRMGFDNKAVAATVVNLAVNGQLTIRQEGVKYILERKRDAAPSSALAAEEISLLNALFRDANTLHLDKMAYPRVRPAVQAMKQSLAFAQEKVYFLKHTRYLVPGALISALTILGVAWTRPMEQRFIALFMTVWLTGWTFGVLGLLAAVFHTWRSFVKVRHVILLFPALFMTAFSIPFLAGEVFGFYLFSTAVSLAAVPVLMALLLFNILFYQLLKAPTHAGRLLLDQIDGFKLFLDAGHAGREFPSSAPQDSPQVFEKFLPWAMALDMETQWSANFSQSMAAAADSGASTSMYTPVWFLGSSPSLWNRGYDGFASSFGESFSSAISSSSSAPGSSSGGGGGGSSGGGGGGGGGGGW